eukprot:262749_1
MSQSASDDASKVVRNGPELTLSETKDQDNPEDTPPISDMETGMESHASITFIKSQNESIKCVRHWIDRGGGFWHLDIYYNPAITYTDEIVVNIQKSLDKGPIIKLAYH